MFRRLAVFAAGFDLQSVLAVAADGDAAAVSDVIGRLADKSLLVHGRDSVGSRWRMLDTVHAYAREQLDAEEERGRFESVISPGPLGRQPRSSTTSTTMACGFPVSTPSPTICATPSTRLRQDGPPIPRLSILRSHSATSRTRVASSSKPAATTTPRSARAPDAARVIVAEQHAANVAFAEMRGDLAFAYLMRARRRREKRSVTREATPDRAGHRGEHCRPSARHLPRAPVPEGRLGPHRPGQRVRTSDDMRSRQVHHARRRMERPSRADRARSGTRFGSARPSRQSATRCSSAVRSTRLPRRRSSRPLQGGFPFVGETAGPPRPVAIVTTLVSAVRWRTSFTW